MLGFTGQQRERVVQDALQEELQRSDKGRWLTGAYLVLLIATVTYYWTYLSRSDLLAAAAVGLGATALATTRGWRFSRHLGECSNLLAAILCVTAGPHVIQGFQKAAIMALPLPFAESPTLRAATWLPMLLLTCSGACWAAGLALIHPLPLWLHIPIQLVLGFNAWVSNAWMCGSPALQHPAAQQATSVVYSALMPLLGFLPAPPADQWQHGPQGRCLAVLTMAEFALTFLAPTLVLVVRHTNLYPWVEQCLRQRQEKREDEIRRWWKRQQQKDGAQQQHHQEHCGEEENEDQFQDGEQQQQLTRQGKQVQQPALQESHESTQAGSCSQEQEAAHQAAPAQQPDSQEQLQEGPAIVDAIGRLAGSLSLMPGAWLTSAGPLVFAPVAMMLGVAWDRILHATPL